MCGIIGILSAKHGDIITNVVTGLIDLEYRGYDSAGLAILSRDGIKTYKRLGAPSQYFFADEIVQELDVADQTIPIAIGHNRWATHGKPSLQNAHPHVDCSGKLAIVHNGTILNYAILKERLQSVGHIFLSETDTEVIAHLIEEELKTAKTMEEALRASVRQLEGSFGLVVMDASQPTVLYAAKNGSPIMIGLATDEFIVASSPNAIMRHTDAFISLQDGELAVLRILDQGELHYRIASWKDPQDREIQKKINRVDGISQEDLSKGDYETFMLKEIFEQPQVLSMTILGRYDKNTGTAVLGGLIDQQATLQRLRHLYTIGCGTAHNAACVGREIIEQLTNIHVSNEIASEFRYRRLHADPEHTVMLAISQSGETADTIESVKEAKRKGYSTFGIVNVVGSAIAEETSAGIYTRAGAEIGVASTKAFSSQVMVFYLLGLLLARMQQMTLQEGREFLEQLERIPNCVEQTLTLRASVEAIAARVKEIRTIHFLGRGIHLPIAHEAALKFKELTYMETGSYPLGELKHGPIAVIDEHCLSVCILPKDQLFDIGKNSIEQIKAKCGKILLITDESAQNESILKKVDEVLFIPHLDNPLFYPLVEIVPLQLFAYAFATQSGKNVDKPRNLAKSVTVE